MGYEQLTREELIELLTQRDSQFSTLSFENNTLESIVRLIDTLIPAVTQVKENYLESSLQKILQETAGLLGFGKADIILIEDKNGKLAKPGSMIDLDKVLREGYGIKTYAGHGRTIEEMEDVKSRYFTLDSLFKKDASLMRNLMISMKDIQVYDDINQIEKLIKNKIFAADYYEQSLEEWQDLDQPTKVSYDNNFSIYIRSIFFPLVRTINNQKEVFGTATFDTPLPSIGVGDKEQIPESKMQEAQKVLDRVQTVITIAGFYDKIMELGKELADQKEKAREEAMIAGFAHNAGNKLDPLKFMVAKLILTDNKGVIGNADDLMRAYLYDALPSSLEGMTTEQMSKILQLRDRVYDKFHKLQEEARKQITLIDGQTDEARGLIDTVMLYAKSGNTVSYNPVNVKQSIERALHVREQKLQLEGITAITKLNYDGIIYSNSQDIGQVIDNIIKNAEEAMKDSAKKQLSVSLEHCTKPDEFYKNSNYVRIEITDTGKGIDKSVEDVLFTPYKTTNPSDTGKGLGLAMTKRILKAYGGDIRFQSVPGQTTFFIYIPLNESQKPGEAK